MTRFTSVVQIKFHVLQLQNGVCEMKSLNKTPEGVMLLRRRDEPALFEYSS